MTQIEIKAAPQHDGPTLTREAFAALPSGASIVVTWPTHGPRRYAVGRHDGLAEIRCEVTHSRVGRFEEASRITLDLPDRVPLVPFWRPYGAMVLDPSPTVAERLAWKRPADRIAARRAVKSIETREREWQFSPGNPRPPGWIAVYNAAKIGHLQSDAAALYGADAYRPPRAQAALNARLDPRGEHHDPTAIAAEYERRIGPPSMVIGLVWIAGSRPLVPADLPSSFFYAPGRFAWLCETPLRFARPLTLAEVGVRKAPQCIVYVPRAPLLAALHPEPKAHAMNRLHEEPKLMTTSATTAAEVCAELSEYIRERYPHDAVRIGAFLDTNEVPDLTIPQAAETKHGILFRVVQYEGPKSKGVLIIAESNPDNGAASAFADPHEPSELTKPLPMRNLEGVPYPPMDHALVEHVLDEPIKPVFYVMPPMSEFDAAKPTPLSSVDIHVAATGDECAANPAKEEAPR